MSADNFIAILKTKDNKFIGYNCSASMDYESIEDYKNGYKEFEADSIEEAIKKAQAVEICEYGYTFVNL